MTWYEWAALGCAGVTIYGLTWAFFIGRGRLIDGLRRYQQQAAIRDVIADLKRHDAGECACYEFDVEQPFVDAEFARIAKELDDTPYNHDTQGL